MEPLHAVHLKVLGQDPVEDPGFGFGCDYRWNDDYTAFRFAPHRWLPGSDVSYAAWQAGSFDEPEAPQGGEVSTPVPVASEDDDLPF